MEEKNNFHLCEASWRDNKQKKHCYGLTCCSSIEYNVNKLFRGTKKGIYK